MPLSIIIIDSLIISTVLPLFALLAISCVLARSRLSKALLIAEPAPVE